MGHYVTVTHPERGIIAESKIYDDADAALTYSRIRDSVRNSESLVFADSNGSTVFVPYPLLEQCVIRVETA